MTDVVPSLVASNLGSARNVGMVGRGVLCRNQKREKLI